MIKLGLPGNSRGPGIIEIYDVGMRSMIKAEVDLALSDDFPIDISGLPPGLYIVRLNTTHNILTARFIKN
ncbi:MAG: T9SS type A sorting domain-containing protein [Bacteroidales bacterium]|nr:T9SS type A sorting domain-containing protein [Bacteroidales bacterium]